MRSHAKASTAGSIRLQATRLALPAALLAALLALVLVVGSASAANGVLNFFGGEGATGGKFSFSNDGAGGVAVNQAGTGGATAGDFYVVDRGNNRVQQFSAAGAFVRAFGLNVGGPGVHVCTVAASCVAGTASAEAGGMSNPQGIAIDQTNGNVYVTDQGNRRVDVFSANGTFQAAFGWGVDTGAEALELCTTASTCAAGTSGANAGQFGAQIGYLAVAPAGSPNAGHLYVADRSNRRVDQFEPTLTAEEVTGIAFVKGWGWGVDTGASQFEQCTTASECQAPNTSSPTSNPGQFSSNQPQALAVDSNGNVYTAESAGNNRAQKFDSTGNPVAFNGAELNGSPGPADIAVDPTTNRVYAIKEVAGTNEKRVLEFNASGVFIATHASGTTITSANGLAVIQGTTNFYMSSNQNSNPNTGVSEARGVFLLATKVNPTASVEAPSPLTAHSATIKGKVNPQGFTTSYRFEFSSDGGSTWTKIPATDVNLGSGTSDIPVEQNVSDLIGGHSYRYRIVATKPFGAGTVTTGENVFITPASAPQIPATFTTAVTTKAAVLNAEINPNNQATSYHFEWGTADCSSNPCTSVPVPDAGIGSGGEPVTVSKEITGLTPGTTYHFRVVATNATGTTEGPDTTFNTYAPFVPDTDCLNQAFRYGPSANLPDCRAYEMVSPVDKNGGDIRTVRGGAGGTNLRTEVNQASLDGGKVTYSSYKAFGGAASAYYSSQYIASRGADGWSTEPISPHRELEAGIKFNVTLLTIDTQFKAFTDDLSRAWFSDNSRFPLTEDGLEGLPNLYGRNVDGSLHALTTGEPLSVNFIVPDVQGHTPDGSHVIFTANAALTPDAALTGNAQLYDFSEGELHLVSVLPGGNPNPNNSFAGFGIDEANHGYMQLEHTISEDGSRIFWHDGGSFGSDVGTIYVRVDDETTVQVSEGSSATFWRASADGSTAIYSEPSPNQDFQELYEFDVDSETRSLIADEVRGVLGGSDDLSHLYFVSKEDLADGATAGERNLYLYREGTATFIATLGGADTGEAGSQGGLFEAPPNVAARKPIGRNSRVSADGRHVAFISSRSLTGYDNTDALGASPKPGKKSGNGDADFEVFRYDADADELNCVSCNPSGARPVGQAYVEPYTAGLNDTDFGNNTEFWAAAWLPTWENSLHASRALAEDGNRVFFHSYDALLPQDTNGKQDVYQWEAPGSGTCTVGGIAYSELNDGCISLISTGQSSSNSEFMDASPSGDQVFIRTESSIDPRDPGLLDIYVANAGGGYPQPPAPPTPCVGDACQSVPPAPNDPTPASASFRGAGDPEPQRDCAATARRAAKLNRQAKQARRKGQQRRSARLTKRAKRLSKSAARCRRANRRANR